MFSIVLADPPWAYNQRAPHAKTRFGGGVSQEYPLMTDREIYELGQFLRPVLEPDCVLFLWATWPKLDIGLRAMAEWGFKYSTAAFVWEKTTKTGEPATGPGFWTASNTEPVLLGYRGKTLPVARRLINQVVRAPRGRHSAKPPEIHRRIEEMFGPGPLRLELFGRQAVPGWIVLGNEVTGQDIRDDLLILGDA